MESQQEAQKRKADSKLKIIKDLSFLGKIKPIRLTSHCAKYLLEEGEGEVLSSIPQQFIIVYSCIKYDYKGHILISYPQVKVSKSDSHDLSLITCLLSMKQKEKSWFNQCHQPIFKPTAQEMEGLECDELEQTEEEMAEKQKEEEDKERDHYQRTGEHLEITMMKVEYKNVDEMEGKKKIVEQKKAEAKQKFGSKDFYEACKIYKYLDSITSGYSKKLYTMEETIQLDNMNQNSKTNFMKSYFKMVQLQKPIAEQISTHASRCMEQLLFRHKDDPVTLFLHAKWLLKQRYLDQAYHQAEKSYKLRSQTATLKLMNMIKEEKKNKGKLRVAARDYN